MVRLHGGGEEGLGEDVTYDPSEQDTLQSRGPVLPLAGTWTLDSFSRELDEPLSFERGPEHHGSSTTGGGRSRARRSTSPCARRGCRWGTRSAARPGP